MILIQQLPIFCRVKLNLNRADAACSGAADMWSKIRIYTTNFNMGCDMNVFKGGVSSNGRNVSLCAFRTLAAAVLWMSALFLGGCESPEERASGYLASAENRFDDGDVVKAEIDAKNALQIQPKNAKAHFLLA